MKRLIPFIAAVAVIFSALQLQSFATNTTFVKVADTVYGNTAVNSSGFAISFNKINTYYVSSGWNQHGTRLFYCDKYILNLSGVSSTSCIILNDDNSNACHNMGFQYHLGDTNVWFVCRAFSTYFEIGFNTYDTNINVSDYTKGSLNRSIAEIYVNAKANNNHPSINRVVLIVNNSTKFDSSAVTSGGFGKVYQGVVTSSGDLLSSGENKYYYNAMDMTIMWTLKTTWKGISVDDYFWQLYKLNRNVSYIPRSNGITGPGFSIGYQNTDGVDYYSMSLTGLYYFNDSYSLNEFITDLLFMLFDVDGENVSEFDSTRYVWCVPASIDQDQQQDIIDRQDVIVDKLDDIYDAIVGGDETSPSSPSEEQLVNMIDKSSLENARSKINAFDVSAYAAAVSAILYINTAWANYPVFASAIILVGVGFLIFTIINGLKKK